jgi:pilus assembly protein CpaB
MARGGRSLLFLGLAVVVLGILGFGYLFFNQGAVPGTSPDSPVAAPPTPIPNRKIVVANIDIQANTVLSDTETLLRLGDIPETEFNADPSRYFTSVSELANYVTLQTIVAEERITRDMVVEAGLSLKIPPAQPGQPSLKAIVIEVDNLRGVADQIRPGDIVDFLASFDIPLQVIRPSTGLLPGAGEGDPDYVDEPLTSQSTKALLQNIRVIEVRKPTAPDPNATPGPDGAPPPPPTPIQQQDGPPQTGPDGQPIGAAQPDAANAEDGFQPGAQWLLVLAVTDQQAEIIKYSIERATAYTLILRGRGDTTVENTIGVSIDILLDRFGLPLPDPLNMQPRGVEALTPVPATPVPIAAP